MVTCELCDGTGEVYDCGDPSVGIFAGYVTCPDCDGAGVVSRAEPPTHGPCKYEWAYPAPLDDSNVPF